MYQHCEDLIPAYSLTYPDFDLLSPFLSEAFPHFSGGKAFLLTMGDGDLDESWEESESESLDDMVEGKKEGGSSVCMHEQSLIMLHHVPDHGAEEATAVPIPEPIDPSPGIEDVELPEEAESELDEDDSSKEDGDGSESEHDGKGSLFYKCRLAVKNWSTQESNVEPGCSWCFWGGCECSVVLARWKD